MRNQPTGYHKPVFFAGDMMAAQPVLSEKNSGEVHLKNFSIEVIQPVSNQQTIVYGDSV